MSATATPNGLTPVKTFGEGYTSGGISRIPIASAYAESIYTGDPVFIVTSGTIERQDTVATANPCVGVFLGVEYTDPTLNYLLHSQRWPASTVASDALAYVATDPNAVLKIQADGTLAQADVGGNFLFATYAAGNDTNGRSAVALDAGTADNTVVTHPLKLIGFADDGEAGTAFPWCLVRWNTHQWGFDTAGLA